MPIMNAIARPNILYLDKKSLNSVHRVCFGGGAGGGAFSTDSLIFRNSANISSSFVNNNTSNILQQNS